MAAINFSNFDVGWLYLIGFFFIGAWAFWWIIEFGDGFFGNG